MKLIVKQLSMGLVVLIRWWFGYSMINNWFFFPPRQHNYKLVKQKTTYYCTINNNNKIHVYFWNYEWNYITIKIFRRAHGFSRPRATMISIDNQRNITFIKNSFRYTRLQTYWHLIYIKFLKKIIGEIKLEYCSIFDMSTPTHKTIASSQTHHLHVNVRIEDIW